MPSYNTATRRDRIAVPHAAIVDGIAIADAPRAGVTILRAWMRPATPHSAARVIVTEVRPGAPRGAVYAIQTGARDPMRHAIAVHCVRHGLSLDGFKIADAAAAYASARPCAVARAGMPHIGAQTRAQAPAERIAA